MISKGLLEKVPSMDFNGEALPTQYLGYRITRRFAHEFLGRIFTDPISIFPEDMLKPELQDEAQYADSLRNLVETGKSVAQRYFQDGSIEKACPPLRALLELMSEGSGEGKSLQDEEFRKLFDPESILSSDWYEERLKTRHSVTKNYWEQRIAYLEKFLEDHANREASKRLGIPNKLDFAKDALSRLSDEKEAIERIHGCLGTDPTLFS
jgi:hypothetical protein